MILKVNQSPHTRKKKPELAPMVHVDADEHSACFIGDKQWACKYCTLLNSYASAICSICGLLGDGKKTEVDREVDLPSSSGSMAMADATWLQTPDPNGMSKVWLGSNKPIGAHRNSVAPSY